MTLTNNQKKFRKRKERQSKDVTRAPGYFKNFLVNDKQLCARVSEETYETLKHWSNHWGWSMTDTLTHIIIVGTPSDYSYRIAGSNLRGWDEELRNPDKREVRYKGTKGTKQLNLSISSTAYHKLTCHSTALKLSKARIVQSLVLNYQPCTEAQLERNRRARADQRARKERYDKTGSWMPEGWEPPLVTQEEIDDCQRRLAEIYQTQEDRLDSLFGVAKQSRLDRNEEP
jgi:hypothetical protein